MANEDQQGQSSAHQVGSAIADQTKNRVKKKAEQVAARTGKRVAVQVGRQFTVAVASTLAPLLPFILLFILFFLGVAIISGVLTVVLGGTNAPPCKGTCQATECSGTDTLDPAASCDDTANPICCMPAGCTSTGGGGGTPLALTEVAKYLVFNENITTAGSPAMQITDAQQQIILKMFSVPMGSPKYLSLLTKNGTQKIHLVFHYANDGLLSGGAAYTSAQPQIDAWGFFQVSFSDAMKAHWLIHESGHILDRLNGYMSSNSYSRTSLISSDPACYEAVPAGSNKYMITYAYRDASKDTSGNQIGAGADRESFAESLSNNVFCGPGASCNLTNYGYSGTVKYNGGCKATYDWFKLNVFGGVDFFGSNTPTATASACTNIVDDPASNTPASSNDCGGAYTTQLYKLTQLASFLHKDNPNFGDPQCTLVTPADRDKLYQLLIQLAGKADADKWFYTVIPCESGYHANSFNPGSASGLGAYGLFQMNPAQANRGNYDIGDVNWPLQTSNAVNRNIFLVNLNLKWHYWACARAFWQ